MSETAQPSKVLVSFPVNHMVGERSCQAWARTLSSEGIVVNPCQAPLEEGQRCLVSFRLPGSSDEMTCQVEVGAAEQGALRSLRFLDLGEPEVRTISRCISMRRGSTWFY